VLSNNLIIKNTLESVQREEIEKYSGKRAQRMRPVKSLNHIEI